MAARAQLIAVTNDTAVMLPRIESRIVVVRGQKMIVDADLVKLYDLPTKTLIVNTSRYRPQLMLLDTNH